MSYTVRDLAKDLLGYLAPKQRTMPPTTGEDDPFPAVLTCLNATLAEFAILGPVRGFQTTRSFRLRTPQTLAVTGGWTQDATTVTIPDLAAWMLGCTIRFGSEPYNRIIGVSGTTVTLQHPFLSTGSGSGLLYHDCVTPAADVLEILEPVYIPDQHRLKQAHSPTAFNALGHNPDYGMRYQGDYGIGMPPFPGFAAAVGEPIIEQYPLAYWVDIGWGASSTPAKKQIRLSPMPDFSSILVYGVKINPPVWVRTDIYADATPAVDPGTLVPIEDARILTAFLPMARYKFAGLPLMADNKARAQIAADYEKSMETERRLTTVNKGLNPTPNPEW
jgi:hypothetical protein